MGFDELRASITSAAELLEQQAAGALDVRRAIEALRGSMIASAAKRATLVGFTGSPDELDAAFEEWLGLRRFDAARLAVIAALSDPMDEIPRP